jgi:hypothetical protein
MINMNTENPLFNRVLAPSELNQRIFNGTVKRYLGLVNSLDENVGEDYHFQIYRYCRRCVNTYIQNREDDVLNIITEDFEKLILKYKDISRLYLMCNKEPLNKDDLELSVSESADESLSYAVYLKGRFEKGEKAIIKNLKVNKNYINFLKRINTDE